MAREGLRTLVVARKRLSDEMYEDFRVRWVTIRYHYDIMNVCSWQIFIVTRKQRFLYMIETQRSKPLLRASWRLIWNYSVLPAWRISFKTVLKIHWNSCVTLDCVFGCWQVYHGDQNGFYFELNLGLSYLGDKIETATCIAVSSKLVSRNQQIHQVAKCTDQAPIFYSSYSLTSP